MCWLKERKRTVWADHTAGVTREVVRHPAHQNALRVDFAAAVWPEIGRLPSDTFRRLRERLDRLAHEHGREEAAVSAPKDEVLAFTIDEVRVRCIIDRQARVLTVVGFGDRPQTSA